MSQTNLLNFLSLPEKVDPANLAWVEAQYFEFLRDPNAVSEEWREVFATLAENESADDRATQVAFHPPLERPEEESEQKTPHDQPNGRTKTATATSGNAASGHAAPSRALNGKPGNAPAFVDATKATGSTSWPNEPTPSKSRRLRASAPWGANTSGA